MDYRGVIIRLLVSVGALFEISFEVLPSVKSMQKNNCTMQLKWVSNWALFLKKKVSNWVYIKTFLTFNFETGCLDNKNAIRLERIFIFILIHIKIYLFTYLAFIYNTRVEINVNICTVSLVYMLTQKVFFIIWIYFIYSLNSLFWNRREITVQGSDTCSPNENINI